MKRQQLNPESLLEGVHEHYKRRYDIDVNKDKDILGLFNSQEIAGFRFIMIVHKVYAPFFLSQLEDITQMRHTFIQENGGFDNIIFREIERTGEVVVLFK